MVSRPLLDIVIHAHNTYPCAVRLTVAFAWVGWWLALIACIVIFATDMSASELLNKERQREADRVQFSSGMGEDCGGPVRKGDFLRSSNCQSNNASGPMLSLLRG
jgi:hypothetical protein